MPYCTSVLFCDVPIRFDTYRGGCVFACSYCSESIHHRFKPRPFESCKALKSFILGKRNWATSWCDWDIPIHWGVLSEPFPLSEIENRRSYRSLIVLAEAYYPVVITTKSTLLYDNSDYFYVFGLTNNVLQVSMTSKDFSLRYEKNAPSFRNRFSILYKLAQVTRRLVVRSQPFMVEYLGDVLSMIPRYSASGVYGLLIGGMTFRERQVNANYRVGDGWNYDAGVMKKSIIELRDCCHSNGIVFLTNEMEHSDLSDSRTCCGCDLFEVNKSNLNHLPVNYSDKMKESGTGQVFRQHTRTNEFDRLSYFDVMERVRGEIII